MLSHGPRGASVLAEGKKVRKLESYCPGRPEANIVEPVVRKVPIAVGDAAEVRDAAPRATAYDAVGAGFRADGIFFRAVIVVI